MQKKSRTDWKAFAAIGLGTVVVPLDSAVNVAFPAITEAFAMPPSAIQWVIVCYVISNAILLLVFGRAGDLFGHLAVFQAGLVISALAFLGSGMAVTLEILLATRALQGIGAAMILSCGPALATAVFCETRRVHALAAYAAVLGLAMTLGPSLGGLMVAAWGWSSVFWFRLPIALIALVLSIALAIPRQAPARGRFDALSATALAAGLAAVLMAISRARSSDATAVEFAAYATLLVIACVLLRRTNRRADDAVIALSVFRNARLSLITATGIAVNLVAFGLMLLVPFYLARMTTLPVALAGLVLAASPLGVVVGGQCAPHLARRAGAPVTALAGAMIVAAATGWISTWHPGVPAVAMGLAALLHGAGLGLYQVAQLDITTAALPPQNRGVAGALVMLTRTLGVVMSASALMALFVYLETVSGTAGPDEAFLSAFQGTFRFAAAGLGAFLALALLVPATWTGPRPERQDGP